ncbi:MAG: hypothetical protein WC972_02440 [Trueperaceae bacterium]
MRKKGNVWLDRAVMRLPLYYCLCVTEVEFCAEMKKLGIPPPQWPEWVNPGADATTHHVDHKDGGHVMACAIVCVRGAGDHTGVQMAAMLVHEAVHIWRRACELWGEWNPSREFEAYSIQAISQELMQSYADRLGGRDAPRG